MDNLWNKLLENSCAEANPVLRLIEDISSVSSVADIARLNDINAPLSDGVCARPDPKLLYEYTETCNEKTLLVVTDSPWSNLYEQENQELQSLSFKLDPLQTLFLSEPQFFHSALQDIDKTIRERERSDHRLLEERYTTGAPHHLLADVQHAQDDHHDDCTPKSGPNYLIEIQNPNWEAAIHIKMVASLDELWHSPTTGLGGSNTVLQNFSQFFYDSLVEDKSSFRPVPDEETVDRDFLSVGRNLMENEMVMEAVPFLEKAITVARSSTNSESWTLLALSQYLVQNDCESITACKHFLRLQLQDNPSNRNIILLLLATCQSNEGDQLASQATIFEWAIGYLRLQDGTVQDILQFLTKEDSRNWTTILISVLTKYGAACKMDYDGPLNWALAVLYFSIDEFLPAENCFLRVLAVNPKSPSVLNQISACLHNRLQFSEALNMQDQALKILQEFPRAVYNQAITLHSTGNTRQALTLIQSVMARQETAGLKISDQFWCLAARLIPYLPAKLPDQYRIRTKLMTSILRRNFRDFEDSLSEYPDKGGDISGNE